MQCVRQGIRGRLQPIRSREDRSIRREATGGSTTRCRCKPPSAPNLRRYTRSVIQSVVRVSTLRSWSPRSLGLKCGRGRKEGILLLPPQLLKYLQAVDTRPTGILAGEKNRETIDGPFSGPCIARAYGYRRLTYPSDGEVCSDTAHPCRNCPKRFPQTNCA
jgi:hypothetical protein